MSVQAGFLEVRAAADFLGNGAIEVNMYENEIFDIVRRKSAFLNRLRRVPATGAPHRYFEQTAVQTATFTDPRNIAPTPSSPTRVERSAVIKALTAQSNFSLFDVEVTKQQGQFSRLEAQDISDIASSITLLQANAIWNGTDTSLTTPTTTQYVGMLTQITQQFTIAPGVSIIDALKADVATMVANTTYEVMPTAIAVNPILGDLIDREAKASNIILPQVDIAVGMKVNAINTQAGTLPIVPDMFLPAATGAQYGFNAPPVGNKNYFAAILTESAIEMPYIGGDTNNSMPRIFQLGLLSGLQGQYVGILFNSILCKGPSYAHAIVAVQRP